MCNCNRALACRHLSGTHPQGDIQQVRLRRITRRRSLPTKSQRLAAHTLSLHHHISGQASSFFVLRFTHLSPAILLLSPSDRIFRPQGRICPHFSISGKARSQSLAWPWRLDSLQCSVPGASYELGKPFHFKVSCLEVSAYQSKRR